MGKYHRPAVLNIPNEPAIILAASYFKKEKANKKEPPEETTVRYAPVTTYTIPKAFVLELMAKPKTSDARIHCYISAKTNCVILAQNNDPDGRRVKLSFTGGKNPGYRTNVSDNLIPPLSYGVAVRDFYLTRNLLIFRWPLLLYDQPIRSPYSQHRTIDRQRRESQFIEATFPSLRQRPEPYPFFIPTLPLDPFWTPPNVPEMADPSERNPDPGAAQPDPRQ